MTAPAIVAALEDHLALWKARVPVRAAAAHFVAVVLGDYALWMSLCMRMFPASKYDFRGAPGIHRAMGLGSWTEGGLGWR